MSNQKVLNPQNRRNFIFLGYPLVLVLFWKNYIRLSTPEIYPVWTPLFSESCSWFVYITVLVFILYYFSFYCHRTKLLELATTNAQKTSLKDDAKKGGETKNKRSSIANTRRRKVIILFFFHFPTSSLYSVAVQENVLKIVLFPCNFFFTEMLNVQYFVF